ncbi:MAG TPA: 2-oxo-tetronate isomerase [Bryobacteraceae bacterium]|nr:2-oxo-tetronate isomerase [Bryobacteraceae bacterium]
MPKFAANLSMMFNEVGFLDRFAAAAGAGFQGVEYLFPYEHPVEEIAARLREHKLENVLFNLPPGDWAAGDRGTTCVPGREEEFRAGVAKALSYAPRLGVRRVHAMAGLAPEGADPAALEATYVSNLRYAADQLAPHGITLVIEPINTRDIPRFYLNTQAQSFAACAAAGRPNIKMQLDLYHMQIVEGDLEMKLRKYAPQCGHIQIAGVPKRQEPDAGEVNYAHLFQVIDEIGYDGWIGCEYKPAGKTLDGLGWWKKASGRTS